MADDGLEIPQADSKDVLHIAVSTAISAVPFLGGGELFKFIVAPSLEKRRELWMQTVAEAIRVLQQQKSFDIQGLTTSEEFVTLLLQATQSALKTHLEAKRELLKAVFINAALIDVEFDLKQSYLSIADRLSPTHVALLQLIEGIGPSSSKMDSSAEVYSIAQREIKYCEKLDFYEFLTFLVELRQAGLIATSDGFLDVDEVYSQTVLLAEVDGREELPHIIITNSAREFMRFTNSHFSE